MSPGKDLLESRSVGRNRSALDQQERADNIGTRAWRPVFRYGHL